VDPARLTTASKQHFISIVIKLSYYQHKISSSEKTQVQWEQEISGITSYFVLNGDRSRILSSTLPPPIHFFPAMARPRNNSPASTDTDSTKSANKERVRFIFEPDRHSPNGITFSWLIHSTYGGKEKAATATRAFWLPFAYRDNGNYAEAELKELAQQSIWRLEEQIQHLQEAFGLEATGRAAIAKTLSPSTFPVVTAPPPATGVETAPMPSAVESPTSSAFRNQDGTLLDEFSDAV
jgi:hypothetical protein